MPSALIRALRERGDIPLVDDATIDAFLDRDDGPEHAILFFTGDPAQRGEANDVAVVLPELLTAFQGRLRAAIIARSAEDRLKGRFHVAALPSLVLVRDCEPLGVIGRIRDWSEYLEKIGAWLVPGTPPLAPAAGPRVEITYQGKEITL